MNRSVLPLLIAVLAICLPSIAGAAAAAKPTPGHHHITIESISAASITVNEPGGSVTYKITPNTEITYAGQTTTVDQLQSGMRVHVTPDSTDPTVADQVAASEAPKDPPPKPSPKK